MGSEGYNAGDSTDGRTLREVRSTVEDLNRDSRTFERRLRGIIDQLPIGVHILGPEGRSLLSNRAWDELWYLEDGEEQANIFEDENLRAMGLTSQIRRSVADREAMMTPPMYFDPEQVGRDGEPRWLRSLISPVTDETGELREIVVFIEDATEYKEFEIALQESRERFKQIFDQSVDALLIHDQTGRIIDCNAGAERSLGYSHREMLSLTISDIAVDVLSEEERRRRDDTLWKKASGGKAGTVVGFHENAHRRKDGTVFPVEVGVGSMDYDGQRVILASCRDITQRIKARDAVRESEARHRAVVDTAHDAILTIDASGKVLSFNQGAERIFGYAPEEVVGRDLTLLIPERFESARGDGTGRYLPSGLPRVLDGMVEMSGVRKSGEEFPLELTVTEVETGKEKLFTGIIRDVTDRRKAEQALKTSEARLKTVITSAPVVLFMLDMDGVITFIEGRGLEALGITPDEFIGRSIHDVIPRPSVAPSSKVSRALAGEKIETEAVYGGRVFDIRYTPTTDDEGVQTGVAGLAVDITERKKLEAKLSHQALHDSLTGLANRALLLDRLDQALFRAGRRGEKLALLYMDLDNFKYINDTLGHDAGDAFLIETASRFRACVRAGDTVARLGGDEFVILLEEIDSLERATSTAIRVSDSLKAPLFLEGREVVCTASIGVAISEPGEAGDGRRTANEVLRDADMAMYSSKGLGKDRHAVFHPSMSERSARRLDLENDLRKAVERDEFVVHYQPRVSIETQSVIGFEALVRWMHPERGLVGPNEFIPLAEETGLVKRIGHEVLFRACGQLGKWKGLHPEDPGFTVNVNASARQIQDPDFVEEVKECLEQTGLEPFRLTIEVTESTVMDDSPTAVATLRGIRDLGVRVALDDFGTGYSSLAYLKELPVDVLKVDRSLIRDLDRDTSNFAIVLSVTSLAHSLGLEVVAEGVETPSENAKVKVLGCDEGQGFFWHRPLPPDDVERLLANLP